ncbi:hypothetical protein [Mycobacteroides salmoniphilum]|uniref:hypothetical protein n=1 Tax=Mycobacteroides salmoniphilum TaxID=404941 RepID=UPI001786D215|nr:hypothetical protein [Mycobacteroides salmoniphilum]
MSDSKESLQQWTMFNDKPDKRDSETDQRQTDITQLDQVIVVDQFGQRSIDRTVYVTDRVIDSLYSFLGFLIPATQAFRLFLKPLSRLSRLSGSTVISGECPTTVMTVPFGVITLSPPPFLERLSSPPRN